MADTYPMHLITNNESLIKEAGGYICIYCFDYTEYREGKQQLTDVSTVICKCGIDACVPSTFENYGHLSSWRELGFGEKYPHDFTQEEIQHYITDTSPVVEEDIGEENFRNMQMFLGYIS